MTFDPFNNSNLGNRAIIRELMSSGARDSSFSDVDGLIGLRSFESGSTWMRRDVSEGNLRDNFARKSSDRIPVLERLRTCNRWGF